MAKLTFNEHFKKKVDRLDSQLQRRIFFTLEKISINPYVGKPMRYARKGTREVYLGHFRLSYEYFSQTDEAVITDFYHKDEQ